VSKLREATQSTSRRNLLTCFAKAYTQSYLSVFVLFEVLILVESQ
jgi:hypothetical protein